MMKVIVLYFMLIQNCFHVTLHQELSTEPDNVVQENESSTIQESTTKSVEQNNPTELNNPHHESLSSTDPTNDEKGLDYQFKTLMRLLKVKGSVTDGFDGASKIFDGMQDVGGELFGMVKDGALNVKNYLPFK